MGGNHSAWCAGCCIRCLGCGWNFSCCRWNTSSTPSGLMNTVIRTPKGVVIEATAWGWSIGVWNPHFCSLFLREVKYFEQKLNVEDVMETNINAVGDRKMPVLGELSGENGRVPYYMKGVDGESKWREGTE